MRKKSHIWLARFLVNGLGDEVLKRRWKAFYMGNLLPDCRPAFLTTRHEYEGTIELVEQKLRCLTDTRNYRPEDSFRYMLDLGQVLHYIADYFTYPHNRHYRGSLKEHCIYESFLKLRFRAYIKSGEAVFCTGMQDELDSVEDILCFLRENHREYIKNEHTVEEDCVYITRVCSQVLTAVLRLAEADAAYGVAA